MFFPEIMSSDPDTIVAIATAPGKGGIGVIRISGSAVLSVMNQLFGRRLKPRYAEYQSFRDAEGDILDKGLALYFPAPHSYTGEEVLELQGHGGPVTLNLILKRILSLGVRMAKPGEFTERAYLNAKLDLAQAEAVADLIASSSEQAAKAAARSLDGAFSAQVQLLLRGLIDLRVYIEAALDFPEEEIDFLSGKEVVNRIGAVRQQLNTVLQHVKQGKLLKDGMRVLILGQPNVGKSSLLNRLSGTDSAIVTDIAGTTRDILREYIHIDGIPLHLIDTAGLRETEDAIEKEGVRRALAETEKADHILLIIDATKGLDKNDHKILEILGKSLAKSWITLVYNKLDLVSEEPFVRRDAQFAHIGLSAKTGIGITLLTNYLKQSVGFDQNIETLYTARQRHIEALQKASEYLQAAEAQFNIGMPEFVAEDLRNAQNYLNKITGEFGSDDLLGEIFSGFCIGK